MCPPIPRCDSVTPRQLLARQFVRSGVYDIYDAHVWRAIQEVFQGSQHGRVSGRSVAIGLFLRVPKADRDHIPCRSHRQARSSSRNPGCLRSMGMTSFSNVWVKSFSVFGFKW